MSDIPAVSVIMPLLDKRNTVRGTLETVLGQTIQDIEVLVMDGGSTDGSVEAVEEVADPRVRLFQEPGTGISKSRNNGVRAARSDFLAFMDADDEWTPVHLANLLKAKERYPHCGVYATNYYFVLPDGRIRHPVFPGLNPEDGFCLVKNYFAASETHSILSCASIALTRQVYEQLGGFPETEVIKHEFCLFANIALNHEIGFCADPSLIYHLDAENRFEQRCRKLHGEMKDCGSLLVKILDGALEQRNYRNSGVTVQDIRAYRRRALLWRAGDLLRIGQMGKGRMAAIRVMFQRGYLLSGSRLLARSLFVR